MRNPFVSVHEALEWLETDASGADEMRELAHANAHALLAIADAINAWHAHALHDECEW